MTNIQKILSGILVAIEEDGPVALRIEVETAMRAMSTSESGYRHEDIAMAVFGSRNSEEPATEEAEADA